MSEAQPAGSPKSPATVEAGAGGAQGKPSGARRLIHILGALLVAVVLPALLMGALVGRLGVSAMFIGLTLGVVGSKIGGTHRMLVAAPVLGYRLSPPAAASVAIVFGVVLGGAAAIGVALGWTEPYWVPEPILVLALYLLVGKRDRIRGKALGTALGVCAAIPVAIIDPRAGVLAALAVIALVLALTQAKKYWLMYGLYTFALVLFLASPGNVGYEAEERGVQILVGIGLLVVGLGIIHALSTWLSKRDPQPELAPAA